MKNKFYLKEFQFYDGEYTVAWYRRAKHPARGICRGRGALLFSLFVFIPFRR